MNCAPKVWLLILLLAASAASANGQNPSIPVTLTRIDLTMDIDYRERTLAGTARMSVRNHEAQPTLRVPLQVNRLMEVTSVTDAQGESIPFSQDVVRYSDWPSLQMNQIWIDLPRALRPDDATSLVVQWHGYLTGYTETGMLYVREKIDSAFTILRRETGAFPVLAVPSQGANRAVATPDFEFSARITVPRYEVVATGGRLVSRTEHDSTVTYQYRSIAPVPMLNIAIAPYRVSDNGVRISYFPADSTGAAAMGTAAQRALDRMTQWFGPIGSAIKPAIIEIGDGYGSQAALSAGIFQQASGFRSKGDFGELYHELSHLWNPSSTQVKASRWNEGLAMFVEYLLMEQLDGWVGRESFTQDWATKFVSRHSADATLTTVPLIDYGRQGSTDFSYSVGNFMFAVLYETLGADNFNDVMGGFYQKYRISGATDQEFIEFAKQTAAYDLTSFFNDWFFTTAWYDRLKSGTTLRGMAPGYRVPRPASM